MEVARLYRQALRRWIWLRRHRADRTTLTEASVLLALVGLVVVEFSALAKFFGVVCLALLLRSEVRRGAGGLKGLSTLLSPSSVEAREDGKEREGLPR